MPTPKVPKKPEPHQEAPPQVVEEAAPQAKPAQADTPVYFPNDQEFRQALEKIPLQTRQMLSDLLRANFKYLQRLPRDEALPESELTTELPEAIEDDTPDEDEEQRPVRS